MELTRHSFRISQSNFVAILPAPFKRMIFFILKFHLTTKEWTKKQELNYVIIGFEEMLWEKLTRVKREGPNELSEQKKKQLNRKLFWNFWNLKHASYGRIVNSRERGRRWDFLLWLWKIGAAPVRNTRWVYFRREPSFQLTGFFLRQCAVCQVDLRPPCWFTACVNGATKPAYAVGLTWHVHDWKLNMPSQNQQFLCSLAAYELQVKCKLVVQSFNFEYNLKSIKMRHDTTL